MLFLRNSSCCAVAVMDICLLSTVLLTAQYFSVRVTLGYSLTACACARKRSNLLAVNDNCNSDSCASALCCFSSITGIRHIKISRQAKITNSSTRTHIIFTSHSEIPKVSNINAIARGFAPAAWPDSAASGADNRQTMSGITTGHGNEATSGRNTEPPVK